MSYRRILGCMLTLVVATAVSAEVVGPADVNVENLQITQSLTGSPGDVAEGRKVFADRKLGNCLAC
ncbi:MAG: hypothetical protein AB8B63_13370, partial [Granulosicoccus sp.]